MTGLVSRANEFAAATVLNRKAWVRGHHSGSGILWKYCSACTIGLSVGNSSRALDLLIELVAPLQLIQEEHDMGWSP